MSAPPAAEGVATTIRWERPAPVTKMAKVDLAVGVAELLTVWAALRSPAGLAGVGSGDVTTLALSGLALVTAGIGLFLLRPLGRNAHVLAVVLGFAAAGWCAFGAGIATLAYLFRPGVRALFEEPGPAGLPAERRARVHKDAESPALIPVAVTLQALAAAATILGVLRRLGVL